MTIRIPLAAARNQLSDLVARVENNYERITLTKHGVDAAVLIAPAELEGLEETVEILSRDDARSEVIKAIRQAEDDLAQGKIADIDELVASIRRRTEP
jgi:prevent-host-death family protein